MKAGVKGIYRFWLRACLAGVALLVMPALLAQGNDRAQAMALEQSGQNAKSEQIWAGIAKAEPHNAEALAHLGLLEARQEHYDAAIGYYRQALAIKPDLPGLQMNLGLALFKAAQFPDAIKSFTAEIRKHPGDQRLTILLGMSHYGMGDYLVAIPYLRKAASNDPQNLPLRMALAHSCLWSKQYQCVLDVYQEILALNAESAEADMLAGEALDEKGDSAGAIDQFRAAAVANPKEPNVHFGLGYLLWTHSQYADAAKEFQSELDNDPQHTQARVYLADSLVELNEFGKALPELEQVVKADPSEALAHRDLGIVYADAGRKEEAVKELQKAIELDPKDVAPHWRIARLYQSMGRKDEAKVEFERANKMLKETNQALQDKLAGVRPSAPH